MYNIEALKAKIMNGDFDKTFSTLYSSDEATIKAQQARYVEAICEFAKIFPDQSEVELFSAPGRTEVGGNHTDHQKGRVLAAAVNLDVIAVVAVNDDNMIRLKSKGFDMDLVDTNFLDINEEDTGNSTSLIRGIADRFNQLGYAIGGFNAYTTSNVLKGSGLSSSAAFEVIVGNILSHSYNEGKVSAVEIAQIGQYAEINHFGKASGLMDQMVSSVGGFVAIDFKDTQVPVIEKIDFDFAAQGYSLCIVDTKGNHADLTPDYVAVPTEMKAVAAYFGKEVLREVDPAEFFANIAKVRESVSDRAVLRAIHFFGENQTALDEANALKANDFELFKALIKKSGNSSYKFLQNIYSAKDPSEQGVSIGLAVSETILGDEGVCRVHGGGFAGTIQNFVPVSLVSTYKETIEKLFGEGSCYILNIRPVGGTKVSE